MLEVRLQLMVTHYNLADRVCFLLFGFIKASRDVLIPTGADPYNVLLPKITAAARLMTPVAATDARSLQICFLN